ncbi:hypothetical protein AN219_22845 [Streptomyces nanshensis]|nr:hypothetical protein AN219_22845 [Streptomyces nanshensis]
MQNELLIAEDLMLLMMDDKSGTIAGEGTLYYTLGGAVLVELSLGGRVKADPDDRGLTGVKVRAVPGRPLPDPLLRNAYETVAKRVRGVQSVLAEIGTGLREPVLDRLVKRGIVRRESKKWLGIFPSTSMTVSDLKRKKALVEKVRAVLVDDAEPDTRTAALVGLLSASGTLTSLHRSIPWSGKVYKRAKEVEQASWGAEAVNTAVMRVMAANSAGSAAAVTS